MKALRFGYMEFDSDTYPNKKEAVLVYETASFNFSFLLLPIHI